MSAAAKPPGARQKPVSKQPPVAEGRKDPRPRPIGGSVSLQLEGHDPERFHYVGVFRGDEDAWMQYHWKGYLPVEYSRQGTRIRGVVTCEEGQTLEYKGHVIMALPMEEFIAQQQTAMDRARVLETQMLGRLGARREVGGSDFAPIVNETTEMYEEML